MDSISPAIIEIHKTERHNIHDEVIEQVARVLCRADGCNPDGDIQCADPSPGSMTTTCTLMALPYPSDRRWNAYRGKAETLIKNIFGSRP